ncbi:hypothetical protein DITRI_Ditri07aG0141600 [Diplodiscus trichospermus]
MGTLNPVLPPKLRPSVFEQNKSLFVSRRKLKKKNQAIVPVARLFGPAIFEASKLKVLFLGVDELKHPGKLPRAYTLTHSDVTSKLTLAISHTINNSQLQGWSNKLYRDEVVAEWKKVKGNMSLHVHCHISGGHFLLDLCARLRYFIFCKELPVEALVWVYFHSNVPEFNRVECWGPLVEAEAPSSGADETGTQQEEKLGNWEFPERCQEKCNCCFPPMSLIPWPQKLPHQSEKHGTQHQQRRRSPLPNTETTE